MTTDLDARVESLRKTNPWLAISLLLAEVQRLRAALAAKEAADQCQP